MKNLFKNAVFLTVIMIALAAGSAFALDSFTDKYIPQNNDSTVSKPNDKPETSQSESSFNPIRPSNGGIKGGNVAAVKDGRLQANANKPQNQNPDIFSYSLNHSITFSSPEADGTIMVENDPGNKDAMQLCLYVGDEQKLIYASAMLQPNQHINGDKLLVKLKKGEYSATAVISVYDTETDELKTSIYDEVKITVDDSWFSMFG